MRIGIIDYGAGNLQSVRNALQSLGHDPLWIRDADDLANLINPSDRSDPSLSSLPASGCTDSQPGPGEAGRARPEAASGCNVTLLLPGQGEFGDSVKNLHDRGLFTPLQEWIRGGHPYLGICLGYQLLFEGSDESPETPGLGIFKGHVVRFPGRRSQAGGPSGSGASPVKIPHMGWNSIEFTNPSDPLWSGLPPNPHVYFVHSYYPIPADESLVATTTEYGGIPFASAVSARLGTVAPNNAAPPGASSDTLVATQFHPEKSQSIGLRILQNFLEQIATPNVSL